MTAREPGTPSADPEAGYFQAIEDFFVSRRGDPLFLSNADWTLVRSWRRQGLPLRIVLRGIADALDAHAHSWSRGRKVQSLAYCRGEVEAARERWERALSLGAEAGSVDLPGFLEGLAAALESARGLGPRARDQVEATVRALREHAAGPPAPRRMEAWLTARETDLAAALRHDLGEAVASLEAEVERELAGYAGRMPARVLDTVREESLRRRLFEARGLPRLSLFQL